ncbi:hypothetical protein [Leuconostoc mesenteroides]|uniref:hypothetical protein n=1 Tax=Leuconostoc mesenteroides TaxID=1245 RepID=UPI0021A9217E|nr:hypothetical protein [Leuconostoc mesenteroides]MCT3053869.1 hypothetical protein [Leuconostoc mesenteroides]
MVNKDVKMYIDVRSMSTSPLIWHDYASMVQTAIEHNVKNFIFSNDDFDYNFYAESRFKTMIGNAKINIGIGDTTVNFIKNKIDIHYAINPNYGIAIERLLRSIGQKSITSAHVVWNKTKIDKNIEMYQSIVSLKKERVVSEIGISMENEDLPLILESTNQLQGVDYIIFRGEEYPNIKLPEGIKVIYSSTINQDTFLMINLLLRKTIILRSTLQSDIKLKNLLQEFLDHYSIYKIINELKEKNIEGLILSADNSEILEYMFSNSKNVSEYFSAELNNYLKNIKQNGNEAWWNK